MPDSQSGSSQLGTVLGPTLREVCQGRLGEIAWFRSAWQRGGAATGFAPWRLEDGREVDAMVKLPVGSIEHQWTCALGTFGPDVWNSGEALACCTPRILAAGQTVGGYDFAWLIVERLPGQPLSMELSEKAVTDLLTAAITFYSRAAAAFPVDPTRAQALPDWAGLLDKSRAVMRAQTFPDAQRWNESIKKVQKALPRLEARWAARPIHTWCHGDLHPGNAMRRVGVGGGTGRCVLIDLALVHAGHWVEDGVYLERMFWGRPELLHGVKPVSALAKIMRDNGLHPDAEYPDLANIRRLLMAASSPAFLEHEGHPRYLAAALDVLERLGPQVVR
jgi:hypothetical protein